MPPGFLGFGFEPVRDAFERSFASLGETGASFAAMFYGHLCGELVRRLDGTRLLSPAGV